MSEGSKSSTRAAGQKRRAYESPRLARVDLVADEVLAIGCKQLTTGSAAGALENCIVRACAAAGS